jgi:hypothetical protein
LSFSTTSSSSSDNQQQKFQPITALTPQPCFPQTTSPRHPPNRLALNKDPKFFDNQKKVAQTLLVSSAQELAHHPTLNPRATSALVSQPDSEARPLYSASVSPNSFPSYLNTCQKKRSKEDEVSLSQNKPTRNSLSTMSSYGNTYYNTNVSMESNVAYQGTESDLNSGVSGGFVPGAIDWDFSLYPVGEVSQPSIFKAASYDSNQNQATVSPQELYMAPPPLPVEQSIPSSTETPSLSWGLTPEQEQLLQEFTSDSEFAPTSLFPPEQAQYSADPSPVIRDDMAAEGQSYPPLLQGWTQESSLPPQTPQSTVLDAAFSGVRKNKRAPKALPEINADEIEDPVAKKRAKNTDAARRSRAKKLDNERALEAAVAKLLAEKAELQAQLAASLQANQQLRVAMGQSPAMSMSNGFAPC